MCCLNTSVQSNCKRFVFIFWKNGNVIETYGIFDINKQTLYITVTGSDPWMKNNVYDRVQRHASYGNVSRRGLYPTRLIGSFQPSFACLLCCQENLEEQKHLCVKLGLLKLLHLVVVLSPSLLLQIFNFFGIYFWKFDYSGFAEQQEGLHHGKKGAVSDAVLTCDVHSVAWDK